MTPNEHLARIRNVASRDGRYAPEAFLFVSQAVGRTAEWIRKGQLAPNDTSGAHRGEESGMFHVSGRELLEGFRRLARERWGLLAATVLRCWGIRRTEDVGEIVFLMVEDEELGWRSRECDRREDFASGFDFATAFGTWEDAE